MSLKRSRKLWVALALSLTLLFAWAGIAAAEDLTVNMNEVVSEIEYPFFGVNYVAFWDSIQGSNASKEALKRSGIQVIRFPGGAPAEWYDWSDPYADGWSSTGTADLWNFAKDIPAKLLLQTNPTSNHNNNPSGTHAANWVAYTVNNDIDAPFWEVGNEPDIEIETPNDWTNFQPYIDKFNEHAAAMKAQNSAIKVFGPVGTNAWYWWGLNTLDMFLNKTGNRFGTGLVDGVSLHWYPGPGEPTTGYDQIKALPQTWQSSYNFIRGRIQANDTRNLPVFITETNAATPPFVPAGEVSQRMASALANADLLGAMRNSGVQHVSLFGAIHNVDDNYGLLYGQNESRPADTPTPAYFIFPIWTQSGNTVIDVDGLADPSNTLVAYASKKSSTSSQVLVINKTGASRTVNLSFNGMTIQGGNVKIYELRLSGGGAWDRDVYYNGVLNPSVTSGSLPAPYSFAVSGASYSRSVPAYSITLFDFTASGGGSSDPAHYHFEDGQLHGFYQEGGAAVSSSTDRSFAGSRSLKIGINGNGTYMASRDTPAVPAGSTVTFRVWVPDGANLASIQPYVMSHNWTWYGNYRTYAGLVKNSWNTIAVQVPSGAATPMSRLGVEVKTSSSWNGSVYVDSISW